MNTTVVVRLGLLAAIALLLVAVSGGIVLGQSGSATAFGSPDINVYVPDGEITPGTTTEFTVQLDNQGELTRGKEADRELVTTARSVIVSLENDDAPITIKTDKKSIVTLSETEPRAVPFEIEIPDSAEPGTYTLELNIEYDYTSRVQQQAGIVNDQTQSSSSDDHDIQLTISDDARFRVTNVGSTLRVGEEGDITGTITNVGGEDVTNAEVQFPTESSNIEPLETSVAVGDIGAGESASFRIPIEVGSEAEAVPKRFELPVSFRDVNGIRSKDDDPELLAEIAPERDEFTIEAVNRSVTGGETQVMAFTITNNRDETVTAVEPKLFTDSPFSSDNDEAFIESLDPGESATVSFDLSADEGVTPKTYPVTVDIRYDDGDGDSQISESYRVAVDVLEPEDDGGLPLWILVGGAVATGGIGLAVWGRRGHGSGLLENRVASLKPMARFSTHSVRRSQSTPSNPSEDTEASKHSQPGWPTPDAVDKTEQ